MIETFEFCDRNSCLHCGSKDILIKDVKIVWQTKDIIICGATSSTANIKGIGKTVTLAQALFSLLGYTFFDRNDSAALDQQHLIQFNINIHQLIILFTHEQK